MTQQAGHGGDAGIDEPDVGQTSREDLEPAEGAGGGEGPDGPGPRDDDIESGHLGEPGGPEWAQRSG